MSGAIEIHTADIDAPTDPEANRAFHQAIVDRLIAGARDCGWQGAEFCWYRRRAGTVGIGIRPGEGWPGLEALRAFRASWTPPAEPEDFETESDGQGRMFG